MKVAFTTGHGEPRPDDPGGKGLGNWRARLARVGCEVIDLNLGDEPIPDDLTLLIVAGPVDPFKPKEVARLRAYADRGGPVLLLLGNAGDPSGLEEFLKAHNLEIGGARPRPPVNYEGQLADGPGADARGGVASDLRGDGSRPLSCCSTMPRRFTILGESGRAGAPTRAGGSEPGPLADPADQPVFLGRDRPEEPPADPRPLGRRARAGDRRRGGRPPRGPGPAGRRRPRSSRGWSCSPAR